MDIKKTFGNKIRTLRKEKWRSQEEFGQKCKLHRTYIGIVERWEKNLSLENIEKMSKVLWVDIKEFFS